MSEFDTQIGQAASQGQDETSSQTLWARAQVGGSGVDGLLSSGLGELLERFKQNGQADAAQSWINDGPNKDISPPQLKQAIGTDIFAALEQQTGLPQEELLARLSRELPAAVDKYTPGGCLPDRNA
ncbi:DUF937 domain-containing protein [Bradyrhizobium sp. 139]|uniref:YidB family protein n=1 Tax=Bradyrhizobium sp. 139 TaxID=2782616 RepID=UPI001FF7DD70|nr:YidB family protein [Bradyrhizobium sp. 139]MCK1745296.1 DUF937 domain-containing protein [Bradyrhizobium sp. 139]